MASIAPIRAKVGGPIAAAVPADAGGLRFDQALARLFPEFSRTRLQSWIRSGRARIDGRTLRPKDRVYAGATVVLEPEDDAEVDAQPENLPLEIVHEDAALLVINKAPGQVVHPGAGNRDGTLLNALLHHAPELARLPRAGIVHRLDKDTSGLLVVARTLKAHKRLVEQLQARTMRREYAAVAVGRLISGGTVEGQIGRHPLDRTRFAVRDSGKPAVTHYRIVERFPRHTRLRVSLETGRTHQIRVHMAHIRYPLVGDPLYGGRLRIPTDAREPLASVLRQFRRQALHAETLGLVHPDSGTRCEWRAEPPEDLQNLLRVLRAGNAAGGGSTHAV